MTQGMVRMDFDEGMAVFVLPSPKYEEVLLEGGSSHCKAGEDTCFYSGIVAKKV